MRQSETSPWRAGLFSDVGVRDAAGDQSEEDECAGKNEEIASHGCEFHFTTGRQSLRFAMRLNVTQPAPDRSGLWGLGARQGSVARIGAGRCDEFPVFGRNVAVYDVGAIVEQGGAVAGHIAVGDEIVIACDVAIILFGEVAIRTMGAGAGFAGRGDIGAPPVSLRAFLAESTCSEESQ